MNSLSITERRIYEFLQSNSGDIVPYAAFGHLICVKAGTANLRQVISRIRRKKKCLIEVVPGRGIRLRTIRLKKVPVIDLNYDSQLYANDIQEAMSAAMSRHAESVGFESQIAIMGVAIGALLEQLPKRDRDYFTRILFKNVKDAGKFAAPMRMQ